MKTPISLFLAYRGWFVANIPLVMEIPLVPQLYDVDSRMVFYLDMAESQLIDLRVSRAELSGIPSSTYSSSARVHQELIYGRELCNLKGWTRIDTTGRSVEEVAHEIVTIRAELIAEKSTEAAISSPFRP